MRVLVLGATGMLGSAMLRRLPESQSLDVLGAVRSSEDKQVFPGNLQDRLVAAGDLLDDGARSEIFQRTEPDVVINCISPSRKSLGEGDPRAIMPICAELPHRLASECDEAGARLVHISTDGVFSGTKGGYTEDDVPDATDVYGVAKRQGEVGGRHVTFRTSMIGHELRTSSGLLEWFLLQSGRCKCFSRAVFSGLPTVVLAQIVRDLVLPRPELSGVYHLAASPITKCELLRLIASTYGKEIELVPDDGVVIDRSLKADRFRAATGYVAPDWPALIQTMHSLR